LVFCRIPRSCSASIPATKRKTEQTGLQTALEFVRKGDTLLVWRLDRFGRSLKHFNAMVNQLEQKTGYRISQPARGHRHYDQWRQVGLSNFWTLAEFERNLIRERTQAGLAAARARGRKGGRPKALNQTKIELAYKLYDAKEHTIKEICQILEGFEADAL
jgi:DNA invertase Pin-like site-specific DNA recombinase